MNCKEFQRDLADFMESGAAPGAAEHCGQCQACSELVADLRYIAESAGELLPLHEPSPRVWEGIERAIRQERPLARPMQGVVHTGPFLIQQRPAHAGWFNWVAAAAAVALIAGAMIGYRTATTAPTHVKSAVVAKANDLDDADQQVLSELETRRPEVGKAYEQNLRDVNAYIRAARQEMQQNPDDSDAGTRLMNAYEQKATLYQMASTAP